MFSVESTAETIHLHVRRVEVSDLHLAQIMTARLDARLAIVERDCQDWNAEATKVFVEGTEIGDLIRIQVPTTGDYNPPTAGAGTPPPSPAPQ